MDNLPTLKEKLELAFGQLDFGNVFITESTTTSLSHGENPFTYPTKLEVSWSNLGRATKFYEKVLPRLELSGFRVIDLEVNDKGGQTKATFKVDGE